MDKPVERDRKRMFLTPFDVGSLFVLYLAAMLFGLFIVVRAILAGVPPESAAAPAIIDCVCMSLVGTSIFYVRKLYKAAINDTYTFGEADTTLDRGTLKLRRVGTIAFFVFRPLFGVAFSVLVYSLWRLSLSASGDHDVKLTEGFLYTTISIGFVSGFLAGRLLTMLEGYGTRRLQGFLGPDA